MRITRAFILLFILIAGCSSNMSPDKQYQKGPWHGLFGVKKGLTKEQINNYTILAEVGIEKQNFAGMALPNDYGLTFDSIIYTINAIEGLCAVSVISKSDNDTALLRSKIEEIYGKPTIERSGRYVTWDKQNVNPAVVIAINYAPNNNLIKIFYDNYDRCILP